MFVLCVSVQEKSAEKVKSNDSENKVRTNKWPAGKSSEFKERKEAIKKASFICQHMVIGKKKKVEQHYRQDKLSSN